jgi:hypothetical protein
MGGVVYLGRTIDGFTSGVLCVDRMDKKVRGRFGGGLLLGWGRSVQGTLGYSFAMTFCDEQCPLECSF